jgi:2,3-bisphosphoglycerate-independent phosphoglycerate mutase
VAFRCNLVTLRAEPGGIFMEDYAAGHITSEEAKVLIGALEEVLGQNGRHFYSGVSYRHLLVWDQGGAGWKTYPPHDLTGQEVGRLFQREGPAAPLWGLIQASWPVLQEHDLNRRRRAEGHRPATSIWLWGQGRSPALPTLGERFGLTGAVICAVDLIRGIGLYAGLTLIAVPGATGYLDTNYEGKVTAALTALQEKDLVFVHVEAPDEAGHKGELNLKIQAIEDFDARVVGPLLAGLQKLGEHRVLIMCDHLTPIAVKTHTPEPVPFVLYDSRQARETSRVYSEAAAQASGLLLEQGADLLPRLIAHK